MDNLEESVDKHNKFSVQCDTMKDWLTAEKDKIEECNDVTGEKSDIKQRLEVIKVCSVWYYYFFYYIYICEQ